MPDKFEMKQAIIAQQCAVQRWLDLGEFEFCRTLEDYERAVDSLREKAMFYTIQATERIVALEKAAQVGTEV